MLNSVRAYVISLPCFSSSPNFLILYYLILDRWWNYSHDYCVCVVIEVFAWSSWTSVIASVHFFLTLHALNINLNGRSFLHLAPLSILKRNGKNKQGLPCTLPASPRFSQVAAHLSVPTRHCDPNPPQITDISDPQNLWTSGARAAASDPVRVPVKLFPSHDRNNWNNGPSLTPKKTNQKRNKLKRTARRKGVSSSPSPPSSRRLRRGLLADLARDPVRPPRAPGGA
jgi:hypothetical protein